MHLKNLVTVFFRFGLLTGIISVILQIYSFFSSWDMMKNSFGTNLLHGFIPFASFLAFFIVLWIVSGSLCKLICKGFDEPISLQSLTQEQVYLCIFVYFGLTTFVSSIAHAASVIFQLYYSDSFAHASNAKSFTISQIISSVTQSIFGLWLIFGCRKFYGFLKKFIEPKSESPKS